MKKILGLLLTVMALCCFTAAGVPRAEAARLAIIPLEQSADILNGDAKAARPPKDFSILYWDIANEIFTFPGFEVVSDAAVDAALPTGRLEKYTEEELQRIATECEADVVIAMRLDTLTDREEYFNRVEPTSEIRLTGEYVSLNRVTGKFYHDKIRYNDTQETVLLVRGDWRVELVTRLMRRYMTRTRDWE